MAGMRTLEAFYDYNAWANARVFETCLAVESAQVEAAAPGTVGSIGETLKHQTGVEGIYLQMLRDQPIDADGTQEEYFAHDLTWFAQRSAQVGEGYRDLLNDAAAGFYDEPLTVPWFDFALTKHDGLIQVLSHSAQHRAQVLSVLGDRGIETPNIDYVFFIESGRESGQ